MAWSVLNLVSVLYLVAVGMYLETLQTASGQANFFYVHCIYNYGDVVILMRGDLHSVTAAH